MNMDRFKWPVRPKALESNIVTGDCWRFTVLTDRLIRFEYDKSGVFEDRASQTAFYRDFDKVSFTCSEADGTLTLETDNLTLSYVTGKPFAADTLCIALKKEPAGVWHFGEDFEDLGGTVQTLDGVDGACKLGRGVCSRFGFSIIDDSSSMLLGDDGWVEVRRAGTTDGYFFGYGYDYKASVKDFYRLTGTPPLLPAYALGNWWSRYHKYTQKEYIDLMHRFKDEDIPFSVGVVDMDWHLTEVPQGTHYTHGSAGWTGYTWNKELFPDYKLFLKDLHELGLHTALNLHPHDGCRSYEDMYEQMATACGIDPKSGEDVKFDVLNPDFMKNYFDILHHPYENDGVDFWWLDWQQGQSYDWIHEPNKNGELKDEREVLNPLWLLNHLHILDISRSGKRPMFFSRFAGAGSQRYPIGFSGDTYTTWDSLKFQPYFTATASNIGYSWWSHDIGGHMLGYRNDDLTVRWVQLGVFSPINRLHSTDNEFMHKEAWDYPLEAEHAIKESLRLRHRLFPYLYTMNRRNHTELEPLVQPMYYAYPKRSAAYEAKRQYLFGSELTVAPICEPNSSVTALGRAEVWLPQGHWFDLFDGTHYFSANPSGRVLDVWRSLDRYPVFAKAGAIVPMAVPKEHDNTLVGSDSMEVLVFPGADNTFRLYEDAGDYNDFEHGAFVETEMKLTFGDKAAEFVIEPAAGDLMLIPKSRVWTIRLRGFNRKIKVRTTVDGQTIETESKLDKATNSISITVTAAVTSRIALYIEGEEYMHDNCDVEDKCYRILQRSQCSYELKDKMMSIVRNPRYDVGSCCWLMRGKCGIEKDVADALKEQFQLNFTYGF